MGNKNIKIHFSQRTLGETAISECSWKNNEQKATQCH